MKNPLDVHMGIEVRGAPARRRIRRFCDRRVTAVCDGPERDSVLAKGIGWLKSSPAWRCVTCLKCRRVRRDCMRLLGEVSRG